MHCNCYNDKNPECQVKYIYSDLIGFWGHYV